MKMTIFMLFFVIVVKMWVLGIADSHAGSMFNLVKTTLSVELQQYWPKVKAKTPGVLKQHF